MSSILNPKPNVKKIDLRNDLQTAVLRIQLLAEWLQETAVPARQQEHCTEALAAIGRMAAKAAS